MSVSRNESKTAAALRQLLLRQAKYRVHRWVDGGSKSSDAGAQADRSLVASVDIDKAHVVSSLRPDGKHALIIDIDHPSWLVKSSTEGHYHLYVDVPDGIEWNAYVRLLDALAEAGVIEPGYAEASKGRGHTDVRLPWIKKEDSDG